MSRSQKLNTEDNKILKNSVAKGLESTLQCVPITTYSSEKTNSTKSKSGKRMLGTHSHGSIIKSDHSGLKQKLVNKVKSWSSKDSKGLLSVDTPSNPVKSDSNLAHIDVDIHNLNLAENNFEDSLYKSDLVRAKDSLENLIGSRSDKTVSNECKNTKAVMDPSSSSKENPPSGSFLSGSNSVDNTTKVTWDPWNKLGRKNRKEKKKKPDKSSSYNNDVRKSTPIIKLKNNTVGDEMKANITDPTLTLEENIPESYEYQPYRTNKKSVNFVNEVLVVYFTGDDIINKSTEPLKRELEQQIRNKEMRRGHVPCTLAGIMQTTTHEDLFPNFWHKR